jgi:plastocyanin
MKPLLLAAVVIACLPTALAHGGGPFASPDVAPGQSWSWFFDELGTFDYHCHQHPSMWGRIVIAPGNGSQNASVQMEDFAFSPTVVTLRYGALVNWTNTGESVHSAYQNTTTHMHDQHSGSSPAAGFVVAGAGLVAAAWATRRRRPPRPARREAF